MKVPTLEITQTKIDHGRAGRMVRNRRLLQSLSLRTMAKALGVSAPYLSDLELGKRNWSEKRFNAAIQYLRKR